jgi:DNA-directed RNA polymerase specialized sigma24 family protein
MSNGHSITALLSRVKSADHDAVRALFNNCYARVAAISLRKLGGTPKRAFDNDDVANSAFHEFLSGAAEGRFKKLENREDVWQVLALLVGDKIGDRLRHECRLKRGGGEPCVPLENIAEAVSAHDDPSLEAEINDAKNFFLANLPSDDHRRVVQLLAEGRTHEEIAEILTLSVRTVDRRVEDVRVALPKILGIDAPNKKLPGKRLGQGEASDEPDA